MGEFGHIQPQDVTQAVSRPKEPAERFQLGLVSRSDY